MAAMMKGMGVDMNAADDENEIADILKQAGVTDMPKAQDEDGIMAELGYGPKKKVGR